MLGDVRPYRGLYQGGTGGQTGDGENDQVWRAQHLDRQKRGLELALLRMAQGQVDCVVFQETNLTKVVYTQEASGFRVMVIEAPIAHRGGVTIYITRRSTSI